MTTSKIIRDAFNALPDEYRKIIAASAAQTQLRDLLLERERSVEYHKKHLADIDDHIKNVRRSISNYERDLSQPTP